ncbi:MAG: type II and III secretion system protein [Desulfobulbaceae bacterium]|nr:type II and III secretion system protein [Desulfobulbaceae bacterium]
MKRNNSRLALIPIALLTVMLVSCANQETAPPANEANTPPPTVAETNSDPAQLPVRFQSPSYFIQDEQGADVLGEDSEDYEIKVGANITSTKGPQPLWDILKRVANLKGMSVSWASDVDQNVLVDVDISAEDNYYEAIDNLLRQVDYFHEVERNVIVVKYRETKKFNIPIPYMKGTYTSNVGGNFLAGREAATGTEGTVKVQSDGNKFDIWENITTNMNAIMQEWRTQTTEQKEIITADKADSGEAGKSEQTTQQATRRVTLGSSYYTIDRSVGLITVTAPRPLLEKVNHYIDTLKKELFRQVIIEAKIIEVFLQDNSKIGIDWSQVLKNFDLSGWVEFGTGGLLGTVWPWNPPRDDPKVSARYLPQYPDSMIYRVAMDAVPFNLMLNALNEQGEATVLSNPKITVMNGQPALINVGTDVTYIDSIEVEVDDDTGDRTYTVNTDSIVEGVAFGVMASILDEESVILHLTPITTDIVGDTIEYRQVGFGEVGLPVVQVREVSTMVQVNNGEMLIIGGLIDSADRKDEDFAPVVGNIPFIRYLFGVEEKIKQKRELVILLTPTII